MAVGVGSVGRWPPSERRGRTEGAKKREKTAKHVLWGGEMAESVAYRTVVRESIGSSPAPATKNSRSGENDPSTKKSH